MNFCMTCFEFSLICSSSCWLGVQCFFPLKKKCTREKYEKKCPWKKLWAWKNMKIPQKVLVKKKIYRDNFCKIPPVKTKSMPAKSSTKFSREKESIPLNLRPWNQIFDPWKKWRKVPVKKKSGREKSQKIAKIAKNMFDGHFSFSWGKNTDPPSTIHHPSY